MSSPIGSSTPFVPTPGAADQPHKVDLLEGEYSGQMSNGKPHGKGILVYHAEDIHARKRYEGEFYQGAIQGSGTLTWKDGATLTTIFANGKPSSECIFVQSDGTVYKGTMVDCQPHGQGEKRVPTVTGLLILTGEWRDGVFWNGTDNLGAKWVDGKKSDTSCCCVIL